MVRINNRVKCLITVKMLALMTIVCSLLLITAASANAVAAACTLSPSSGPVGQTVAIQATGFVQGQILTAKFDGVAMSTSPATVTVPAGGNINFAVSIPTTTAGAHAIAVYRDGMIPITAIFTVTAKVVITSPTSKKGPVGTSVTVAGTGFSRAGVTADVTIGGKVLAAGVLVDSTGSFTATGVVPSLEAGSQTVAASDGAGNSAATDAFSVTPIPVPGVTTNAANNVGTTSATLNGNLMSLGGASTASVSFEYGLSTAYGNTTSTQTIAATGLFNTQLTGLAPGTTYHYRAEAMAGDKITYGEDKTFTTSGPTLGEVTSALDDAASAVSEEKSKGFSVTTAEDILAQAQQAFQSESYQAALDLASRAESNALDIDQDGMLNSNDFAPTIKNIYIYAGASAFAFVLIASTASLLTLRWRRKRAEKERVEKEKAEIIKMIEEALEKAHG